MGRKTVFRFLHGSYFSATGDWEHNKKEEKITKILANPYSRAKIFLFAKKPSRRVPS
jgi:hypothetical protein